MSVLHKPIIIFGLMFLCALVQAQTFRSEDTTVAQRDLLNSQQKPQVDLFVNTTKAIYIEQVGINNSVNSNTRASQRNSSFLQWGNNNFINTDVSAFTVNENVFQVGSNNSFFNVNTGNTLSHNVTVYQSGRNQRLLWTGSNSISEKLAIRMKGVNQTIIVRNIKR